MTRQNLSAPDELYRVLARAYDGLSEAESVAFDARLVIVLANRIGDVETVTEAIAIARHGGDGRRD
jgi:hypothetical protein